MMNIRKFIKKHFTKQYKTGNPINNIVEDMGSRNAVDKYSSDYETNMTDIRLPMQHQLDGLRAISDNIITGMVDKGVMISPTGSGKTLVELMAIDAYTKHRNKKDKGNLNVVLSPRIALSAQHLKDLLDYMNETGNKRFRPFLLNSGSDNVTDKNLCELMSVINNSNRYSKFDIPQTTNLESLISVWDDAYRHGQELVVFCTYHSAHKLMEVSKTEPNFKIGMTICDESHNMVTRGDPESIRDFKRIADPTFYKTDKKLYFTATPKHTASDDGVGMNNKANYGDIIYQIDAADLIKRLVICMPRIHRVNANFSHVPEYIQGERLEYAKDAALITAAAKEQEFLPENVNTPPKLLVTCKGTKELMFFMDSAVEIAKPNYMGYELSNYEFYFISAEQGQMRIKNGKVEKFGNRYEFFDAIESTTNNTIVFHIKIIAEGIDIHSFSGVIPLHTMSEHSIIQTIGRAMRMNPKDVQTIREKKYTFKDRKKLIKPYAWVIIPSYDSETLDNDSRVTSIVEALRSHNIVSTEFEGEAFKGAKEFLDEFHLLRQAAISAKATHEIEDDLTLIQKLKSTIKDL